MPQLLILFCKAWLRSKHSQSVGDWLITPLSALPLESEPHHYHLWLDHLYQPPIIPVVGWSRGLPPGLPVFALDPLLFTLSIAVTGFLLSLTHMLSLSHLPPHLVELPHPPRGLRGPARQVIAPATLLFGCALTALALLLFFCTHTLGPCCFCVESSFRYSCDWLPPFSSGIFSDVLRPFLSPSMKQHFHP